MCYSNLRKWAREEILFLMDKKTEKKMIQDTKNYENTREGDMKISKHEAISQF